MYLERLDLGEFRSLDSATIALHQDVTVLVGVNNAGKSNVPGAVRHLAPPLGGRRETYLSRGDLYRDGCRDERHGAGCRTGLRSRALCGPRRGDRAVPTPALLTCVIPCTKRFEGAPQ